MGGTRMLGAAIDTGNGRDGGVRLDGGSAIQCDQCFSHDDAPDDGRTARAHSVKGAGSNANGKKHSWLRRLQSPLAGANSVTSM